MYVIALFAFFFLNHVSLTARDLSPPNTPRRVRTAAQQMEHDQRSLDSPTRHRTPHHVHMMRMAQPALPPPPLLLPNANNDDPFLAPPPAPAPQYHHLPAHLAQQLAALPPLPQQGRG